MDVALQHLQEARVISSIHKNTHPAKYARCLFKLSEALRQVSGQEAEADERLKEAQSLYFKTIGNIRATNVEKPEEFSLTGSDQMKEENFNALVHISQR
ncbi:uncharacterized protein N7469_009719 [Penicillium citrinum]|uniref:Uncharacterized protein n=1 Tax=Penicillium citrinum TaxID=5077 RepID=A0A9W9TFE7_PENCI|nr:uncharacterized protein N7469_009719 [Penicillium citrinum]KAJ5220832.1 hypothetical protein N7469_009719 [Penicillium citrinum]